MLEIDLIAEAEKRFPSDIVEELRKHRRRAIHLQIAHTPEQHSKALPGCWLGGEPTLPESLPWPIYHKYQHEFPMTFIGQFDCAELPKFEEYPVPKTGTLFFFYDFGFEYLRGQADYEEMEKGGCVYYTEQDCSTLPPAPRPETAEPSFEDFGDLFDEEPGSDDFGASPTYREFLEIIHSPALDQHDIVPVLTDRFQNSVAIDKIRRECNLLQDHGKEKTIETFHSNDVNASRFFGEDNSDHDYYKKMDIVPLFTFGSGKQFPTVASLTQFMIERNALKTHDFAATFIGRHG